MCKGAVIDLQDKQTHHKITKQSLYSNDNVQKKKKYILKNVDSQPSAKAPPSDPYLLPPLNSHFTPVCLNSISQKVMDRFRQKLDRLGV